MSPESAELIALKALSWLVGNDELRSVFMGATGVSVEDLRERAGESAFQASVLEFLTMDDAWVKGFCEGEGLQYTDPLTALHSLPGSEQVHWT